MVITMFILLIALIFSLWQSELQAEPRKSTNPAGYGCWAAPPHEPGLVKCEGNCSRICALCELGVYGGDYPDRLVLFDSNGDPSFESQCRYIMPASDGNGFFVELP